MAANKALTLGPVAVTTTNATTIAAPGSTSVVAANATVGSGIPTTNHYMLIRHIRLVNTTVAAITVSLFVGARAAAVAGTEFLGGALSIPANSPYDWYAGSQGLRIEFGATDAALCGGASALGVTFQAEGEIGFA